MRYKNRYLLFVIDFEDNEKTLQKPLIVQSGPLSNVIREEIKLNFGQLFDSQLASFSIKYFSQHTNLGLCKVPRDYFKELWMAMTFVKNYKNFSCCIRVLHVSGTIKQCQQKCVRYNSELLAELQKNGLIKEAKIQELLAKAELEISKLVDY
ncbi:hypothetical protein HDU92_001141 [Lobulomyces angularis]|nr:hypothetical protein HDU92_001141 [Lobulomyces angularis]